VVDQTESALQPLLGEPLTCMWRYAGYQRFEFGPQRPATNRKGQAITVSDKALVVGCTWRVIGHEGPVLSSADFGPDGARRDEGAEEFYGFMQTDPLVVEGVEASELGALRIRMSRGYALDLQPEQEDGEDEHDHWRLMIDGPQPSHMVLNGRRIEYFQPDLGCEGGGPVGLDRPPGRD
jgi:hypothetical protein